VAYVAVLDADVLHPYISVDLLLRLADRRLFRPAWSEEILGELRESLIQRRIDEAAVDRRLDAMRDHFPEAITEHVERFLAAVPEAVDEDDRHVVAAALAARADAIVTRNVRDFAPNELLEIGVEVQSLDAFVLNQWTLDIDVVLDALAEMERDRTRPPRTIEELLRALDPLAPNFARAVRAHTRTW
jgi:predicted nucleic acid-binding protein